MAIRVDHPAAVPVERVREWNAVDARPCRGRQPNDYTGLLLEWPNSLPASRLVHLPARPIGGATRFILRRARFHVTVPGSAAAEAEGIKINLNTSDTFLLSPSVATVPSSAVRVAKPAGTHSDTIARGRARRRSVSLRVSWKYATSIIVPADERNTKRAGGPRSDIECRLVAVSTGTFELSSRRCPCTVVPGVPRRMESRRATRKRETARDRLEKYRCFRGSR